MAKKRGEKIDVKTREGAEREHIDWLIVWLNAVKLQISSGERGMADSALLTQKSLVRSTVLLYFPANILDLEASPDVRWCLQGTTALGTSMHYS